MKERPILFSAPMVRALLNSRKTQTRRPVKGFGLEWLTMQNGFNAEFVALPENHLCPYGYPGDRLYVREAIRLVPDQEPDDGTGRVLSIYGADGTLTVADAWPWRRNYLPSMHCPRGLSRITLEVTAVRVERLQDISDADAQAEGTPCYVCGGALDGRSEADCHCFHRRATVSDYRGLWDSINGANAWAANPWVWVVEFSPVGPEED